MLFEPPADTCYGTLVRVRRRMRAVKHANLREEDDCDSTAFPLGDLGAEAAEE